MSAPLLTDEQIASVCLSYRHDFGLLEDGDRHRLMFTAREWERAMSHEIRAPLLAEIERLTAELQREREARQSAQIGIELLQAQIARLEPMRQRADDIKRLTAERDAAMADAERFCNAACDAATSLETIWRLAGRSTYGNPPIETFMDDFVAVRAYAQGRAIAARAAIDAARSAT